MSRRHTRLHAGKWRKVRREVLERDGYRCRVCGKAGRLEVDHVVRMEDSPGIDPYDVSNLQAICRGCHIAKTADENRRPLSPDELAWRKYLESDPFG